MSTTKTPAPKKVWVRATITGGTNGAVSGRPYNWISGQPLHVPDGEFDHVAEGTFIKLRGKPKDVEEWVPNGIRDLRPRDVDEDGKLLPVDPKTGKSRGRMVKPAQKKNEDS